MLIESDAAARAAAGVALTDMDLWEALGRLTVPTLVIAGEMRHTHRPEYMVAMLEAAGGPGAVDGVLADHGFAGTFIPSVIAVPGVPPRSTGSPRSPSPAPRARGQASA